MWILWQREPYERILTTLLFFLLLFVHFVGWASVPASALFGHLLHLTLLAAVVIFWLNDAWKWISILCDQKRCVTAVRRMHHKQPGRFRKWEYHTEPCRGKQPFSLFLSCARLGRHILKSMFSSVLAFGAFSFYRWPPEEMDWAATPGSHFTDPYVQLNRAQETGSEKSVRDLFTLALWTKKGEKNRARCVKVGEHYVM